jgi:uncharacterized protein YaaW (UPF0174 family)
LRLLSDFILIGNKVSWIEKYIHRKGDVRWSQSLTDKEIFKKNYPNNMKELVPDLVKQLQLYGGNSIFNVIRGHGVSYRKILIKVAKAQKVNFNPSQPTNLIETYLLQHILRTAIEKMTPDDVYHFSNNISKDVLLNNMSLLNAGNPLFLKLTVIAVQQLAEKQGLKIVGGFLAKFVGSKLYTTLTGPVGWAISIAWSLFDTLGPAYRVMFPSVITVAYMRIKADQSDETLNSLFS